MGKSILHQIILDELKRIEDEDLSIPYALHHRDAILVESPDIDRLAVRLTHALSVELEEVS